MAEYPFGPTDMRYPIKAYIDASSGGGTGGLGYLALAPYTGTLIGPGEVAIFHTPSTPEGTVTAPPGSIALADDGTVYVKASGSGNTGWTSILAAAPRPEVLVVVNITGTRTAPSYGCTTAKTGTGVYTITLTTVDRDYGTYVASVQPLNNAARIATIDDPSEGGDPHVKTVRIFDAAGAPIDSAFMFQLWSFDFAP